MPAIITHHTFGLEVYSRLASTIGLGKAQRETFLLGNQGPDPLFYLQVFPYERARRKLGGRMHTRKTDKLFDVFHDVFVCGSPDALSAHVSKGAMELDFGVNVPPSSVHTLFAHVAKGVTESSESVRDALKAYALGFYCHYLLDSTVHPLVFAQERALAEGAADSLPAGVGRREIHAAIETELDEYVRTAKLGATATSFIPHRDALRCDADFLRAISRGHAVVVRAVYDMDLPADAFLACVRLFRMGQTVVDSKTGGLRRRFDYAWVFGRLSNYLKALSHGRDARHEAPFANDAHIAWPHPFKEGATVQSSFDELYQQAFERALAELPQFANPHLTPAECATLIGNVNFKGEPY